MADVLVVGGGGREHALGWLLSQSSDVDRLHFAPGNGGTAELGINHEVSVDSPISLAELMVSQQVELTVVGPDEALAAGVTDTARQLGQLAFGPSRMAARLEWDKTFASQFMDRHDIPHPHGETFNDYDDAIGYVTYRGPRQVVLKANGLAAGKGVSLPHSIHEAAVSLDFMMNQKGFGEAGKRVLIQDRINGTEVSVFALCGRGGYQILPQCQDYKRLLEGDKGPNTGGMGAIASVSILDQATQDYVEKHIIQPTLAGMEAENNRYEGILYLGLMLDDDGPQVVEYNARFGDPECQALAPLVTNDFHKSLMDTIHGAKPKLMFDRNLATASIALADGDYPIPSQTPKQYMVHGLGRSYDGVHVFHGGTERQGQVIKTLGGRVLHVVGEGLDIPEALGRAYNAIGSGKIHFNEMQYRTDIGSNL